MRYGYLVTLCPFLKRVCDESSEFVCNNVMSLALSDRLCLETTESQEQRGAVVCIEAGA